MLPLEARRHRPLDRTLIVSILLLLEAYHRLTDLVVLTSSPTTNLVISILSPMNDLSLSLSFRSLFLPPSLSLTKFFSLINCFEQIFVSLCVYIEIFRNKIYLGAEKMWKICREIAFLECYQTPKIIFRTIFHCKTKHSDIIFLTGIHFPLHSFYTRNSIYIEPNAALESTSSSS